MNIDNLLNEIAQEEYGMIYDNLQFYTTKLNVNRIALEKLVKNLDIPRVSVPKGTVCRIEDYTKCPLFQEYKEGCHTCNFDRQTAL